MVFITLKESQGSSFMIKTLFLVNWERNMQKAETQLCSRQWYDTLPMKHMPRQKWPSSLKFARLVRVPDPLPILQRPTIMLVNQGSRAVGLSGIEVAPDQSIFS
jgi:hypothetical protein